MMTGKSFDILLVVYKESAVIVYIFLIVNKSYIRSYNQQSVIPSLSTF